VLVHPEPGIRWRQMGFTLSPMLSFNCFNMGGIILHGPHHSAEKSTKTGISDVISSLKFAIACFFCRY
jgi:hypothetical protein